MFAKLKMFFIFAEDSMILQNQMERIRMLYNIIERFRSNRRVQKARRVQKLQNNLEYCCRRIQNKIEQCRIFKKYLEECRILQKNSEEFRIIQKFVEENRSLQNIFEVQNILEGRAQCRTFEKLFLALPRAENAESKKNFFCLLHRNSDLIYQIWEYEMN